MYPPHHLGGYELACRDAVNAWRRSGHDVVVLTSDVVFPHKVEADETGVHRELRLYWRDGVVISPPPVERLRIERHNRRVLDSVIDAFRPNVASLWHMGAMSLSAITELSARGVPQVFVIYDDWLVYGANVDAWMRPFARHPHAGRLISATTRMHTRVAINDSTSAVLFMSNWLRERAETRSPLPLPSRRAVVYGGINTQLFHVNSGRSGFGWRLLCAGRIEERKGVHVAVEALAQLPSPAQLDVIGTPDDQAYVDGLQARARQGGFSERLHLRPPVSRAELADALRSADVFVFPVVWDEPFGMAPLEAMACGTPVIGTGTGGSGEFLIHEENCLRVPPNDPNAIADAAQRLAADDGLRTNIIDAGIKTAQRFSDDRYIAELTAWHTAAAERFRNGRP